MTMPRTSRRPGSHRWLQAAGAAACLLATIGPPCRTALAADLAIGLAVPLGGADAPYGESLRRGAEMAVADARRGSGADGAIVPRLVVRDDGNDPAKAVAVARGLLAAGTRLVIGDLSSAATVPASAVYADAGALLVVPVAAAPAITERGYATVFRLAARGDAESETAVRLLLARHVGRVAVVHDRTVEGKGFADAVRSGLARAGVADVFYGSVEKGARDPGAVAALAGRIRASGAQVVVFGGGPGDGGGLVRQLRDAGSRAIVLGDSALASDDFAAAGGTAADGTMLVFPEDPRTRPAAADLLRRLRARGSDKGGDKGGDRGPDKGGEPDAFVFYGYAAVQLILQAADAAHSAEPAAIAAALHAGRTFDTVLGPVAFDGKGDRTGEAGDDAVYVWHKGAAGRMALDEQVRF